MRICSYINPIVNCYFSVCIKLRTNIAYCLTSTMRVYIDVFCYLTIITYRYQIRFTTPLSCSNKTILTYFTPICKAYFSGDTRKRQYKLTNLINGFNIINQIIRLILLQLFLPYSKEKIHHDSHNQRNQFLP